MYLQVTLCDPRLSALSVRYNFSETYIDGSSALLTLTFSLVFAYTDYCFYIFYVIQSRYVRL